MKNYRYSGSTINAVLTGTVASGAAFVLGAIVVVAQTSGVNGDTITAKTDGVYELPKAVGAISQGAKLYWDDTAKNVTTTVGSNLVIGYAFISALSGDATVEVMLDR